jgi:hypothetical protein
MIEGPIDPPQIVSNFIASLPATIKDIVLVLVWVYVVRLDIKRVADLEPEIGDRLLSWTLANFRCSETAALQVFLMPAGIFARSRARPGPTKNSVYPYILGHFAHPPLEKWPKSS